VSVLFQVNIKGWNKIKKEDFIEIYKIYDVEVLSGMFYDNIIMYEKKVANLHEALRKEDIKIKNQAEEITKQQELRNKLNMANEKAYDLMKENARLRDYGIESIYKMDDIQESQMKVAECEIKRLNIIIHYLETKGL
jgi:hypothetical protein